MHNRLLCTFAGLLVAAVAGPALAADMAVPAPVYKAPPVVAAPTWAGFYIGANGGWASSQITYPGVPDHAAGGPADLGTPGGGLYGGQIGYNFQIQNWVLGVEGSFDGASGLNASALDGNFLTESNSVKWVAMARARVGYAFGNFLPYVTVGGIWENASAGESCPSGAGGGFCQTHGAFSVSDTQVHSGVVWGGGLEYAFAQHWSAKVEGLHADLSTQSYTLGAPGSPQEWPIKHDFTAVLGGVNYRF